MLKGSFKGGAVSVVRCQQFLLTSPKSLGEFGPNLAEMEFFKQFFKKISSGTAGPILK